MTKLNSLSGFERRRGPVVLVIMDGVGFGKYEEGDAVKAASTPTLDALLKDAPNCRLKAHGRAVGLPSDADMGNSEVGHNAMGAGRVFDQGASLVSKSITSGDMFAGKAWREVVDGAKADKALHFLGLFSDGNVHSHIDHLKAMVERACAEGVKKIRVHILLDGRDVGETSALDYVIPFEAFLAEVRAKGCDARIASGGGRMFITMDRYGADWSMVERGWKTHVLGEGRQFASAQEAIETLRQETGAIDQDLGAFVIAEGGVPVGAIEDGDSVVLFNFRGDRALEITAAFESGDDFDKFERGRVPRVTYAGMMEYDGDLHVPQRYLVAPPAIDRTLGEYLCALGLRTLAVSETQKFGHVTSWYSSSSSDISPRSMRSSNSRRMRSISSCGVSLTEASGTGPAVSHVTSMPHSGRSKSPQSRRSAPRSHEPKLLLSFRAISLSLTTVVPSGSTAHMMSRHFKYFAAARRKLPPKTTYRPLNGTTIHPRASASSGVPFMLLASRLSSVSVHSLGFAGSPGICPVLKSSSVSAMRLKSIIPSRPPCRSSLPLCSRG